MNKLQRIEEMEKQLAALRAEVENESKQWHPIGGEYCITPTGDVSMAPSDTDYGAFGTERPTKEQAEKARDEMRAFNRLLAYRDEFDPDFEYDDGWNFYIEIDIDDSRKYTYDSDMNYKRVGVVYMSEKVAEELCDKLNSGEVVL